MSWNELIKKTPKPPGINLKWGQKTQNSLRLYCYGWTNQDYNTISKLLAGLVYAMREEDRFEMIEFIRTELDRITLTRKTEAVKDIPSLIVNVATIIHRDKDRFLSRILIKSIKKDLKVIGKKLPPVKTEYYKERIRGFIRECLSKIGLEKGRTPLEFMKEVTRYAQGIGFFTAWNSLAREGNIMKYTFPAMLYALPIPHVQELEVARSGMVIKFRATGSVFLANQEGGEDAVRIHHLILGDEMYMLMLLWGLFLYGRGKTKEIEAMTELKDIGALRAKMTNITSYDENLQKPTYEFHKTFPLVTRHIIIPNVYIETFSFEDKVVDGKDVLRCTVLLRTYRKPPDFAKYVVGETTHITVKNEKRLMMYQSIEYSANIAWRLFNSGGYIFNEREWKTGTDPVEHDDVYYNIGEEKIVHNAVLGLFGLM